MKIRLIEAKGVKLARMKAMGWWAMAEYPDKIVIRVPKGAHFCNSLRALPRRIIRHEVTHLKQMHQDGLVKFRTRYWAQAALKGYKNVDYEIEARAAENDPTVKYEIINLEDFTK